MNIEFPIYFTFSLQLFSLVLGYIRVPKIELIRFTPEKQDCRRWKVSARIMLKDPGAKEASVWYRRSKTFQRHINQKRIGEGMCVCGACS